MPTSSSPRSPHRVAVTAAWVAVVAGWHVAWCVATLGAQASTPPGRPAPGASGAADVGRQAQRRFEALRRASLPVTESRGGAPCDANVGRYCYWYDPSARPPARPEADRVTSARHRLLAVLDSLAVASPGDAWIDGQRVRYRIDALDTAGAVQVAASSCGTPGWWCHALRGYALHNAGSHDAAGRAFDRALAAMPPDDRCAWENPAVLLERAARDRVQRMSCDERRAVAARLLWLGDPQLGRPGNDLRTELLARRVESVLESDARFVRNVRWSWDANEILIRYGWATWWTRERSYSASGPAEVQLIGHHPVPAFDFMPSPRAVLDPRGPVRNDDWAPTQDAAPMRYAPSYLAWWRHASAQVARLRRGDTLLVIAAFEAPQDTMLDSPRAVLVLSAGPEQPTWSSPPFHGLSGVLQARIPLPSPSAELVASLEVVDTARRAMARHRMSFVDAQPRRMWLSDLILHVPLTDPPALTALSTVIDHLLPSSIVSGERIGVFWEAYGFDADGESLDITLSIERLDAPWLRRAAARLRLADPVTPVDIRWRESARGDGAIAARTMSVNIATLASGEYRLRLRAQRSDGTEAVSERVIQVRK